ncbi:MAG TPA: G8 domain-containing protein [Verrucomicrobiales bacterium]|nr:G8 domain-containing protein [Verrucomicrobiales bacterium]
MRSLLFFLVCAATVTAEPVKFDTVSTKSGPWSDAATWGGRLPQAGARVQVKAGHTIIYDVESKEALRMVHVAGTLTFSREKNTLLEVGLLRVTPGDTCSEDGFDCHDDAPVAKGDAKPGLEIGTLESPIPANVKAVIRLRHFEGMNPETLPAIVACSGRWDIHGSPMPRTWLKLTATVKPGASEVTLEEKPDGWRTGDRIIVTGSKEDDYQRAVKKAERGGYAGATEERLITKIDGAKVTFDQPLTFVHFGEGIMRSEVALLSRNVIVESADPAGVRGHTMYHRDSSGGISYAEFRHLGKRGILGKYAIHFHLVRDTMRGSGVTGASVWDSDNRWITVHGSDHLLVRDCVGYRSRGHGYFLEDATEQWNVFDRNLAVQAIAAKRLPKQVLSFDANDGAGFWWANGRNTFTRNVACENDEYGFRFELRKDSGFNPVLRLRGLDGELEERDVRTLPFVRFEDNESHTEGLYSFNLGDDKNGEIHSDRTHPFIVRNLRAWETHYVLRPEMRSFLCEGLRVKNAVYGVYNPDYDGHVYRDLDFDNVVSEPINRGHDDASIQYGDFTYERVRLANCRVGRDPLIQLACTAPKEGVSGHFRDLHIENSRSTMANVVDLGGGPRNDKLQYPVSYYFHEPEMTRRVVSVKFPDATKTGGFVQVANWTGPDVVAAEVKDVPFPVLLDPKDELPPATLITRVRRDGETLHLKGVTQDNGSVAGVTVNGAAAKIISQQAGVADWEVSVPAAHEVTAKARDAAGNEERWVQVVSLPQK